MRFLLDQGISRVVPRLLAESGHQARHVGDLGMAQAADRAILAEAARSGEVVVTSDADFHAILATERLSGPSAIRIRLQSLTEVQVCTIVLTVASLHGEALQVGAMVTVDAAGSRCRPLPV